MKNKTYYCSFFINPKYNDNKSPTFFCKDENGEGCFTDLLSEAETFENKDAAKNCLLDFMRKMITAEWWTKKQKNTQEQLIQVVKVEVKYTLVD